MNKVSRKVIITLITIFVIIILANILINIFVNKENIKNIIAKQFYEKTNYNIEFKGDFKLKIFPLTGINADNVIIINPKAINNKQLANIGKTKIRIEWLPLLHKKISISTINIDNLIINIEKQNTNKNIENKNNINQLTKTDTIKNSAKSNINLEVHNINISNITINFLEKGDTTKLVIDNLQTNFKINNNLISLSSLIALLYKGKLRANTTINLSTPMNYKLKADLKNFDVHEFLKDFYNFKKLYGAGILKVDLESSGNETLAIKQNLIGKITAKIYNGYFTGMNILNLLNFNLQSTANIVNKNNNFASLLATANIKNGIITNNDFYMNAPLINIDGKGTINILNMRINYNLNVKNKNNKVLAPLTITGDIYEPNISIGATSAIKNIIENKAGGILDDIKNTLKGGGNGIKSIFGG